MSKQDWKFVTIVFAIFLVITQYFVNANIQHRAFEISTTHIKYHANFTSYEDLKDISELQKAYEIPNINTLDLSFSMSSHSLNHVKSLLPSQFQQYKKMNLNFGGNPIGSSGADYILSLIPNGVESLNLSFDSIDADSSLGHILAKRLNNLNSLKHLSISLILAVKKGDYAISEYLKYSRPSPRLESYSLILIGNELSVNSTEFLASHLERTNLKVLDLNFYMNRLGVEGGIQLAKALKTQKLLEMLSVDLYFNNITEVGTEEICKAVQQINQPKLKHLTLNFDFNYIKNEGAKSIGNLLPHLQNVESLYLGVASKNFAYIGYKYIINGLSALTNLRELSLRCGINRVGYNGAQITADMVSKLTKLEYLGLDFNQNYVGDDGIVLLTDSITKLVSLKSLYLNLAFNDAKSYGLIRVIQSLAKKEYAELYLSLSSNEFKDADVKLIRNDLPKLIQNNKLFTFEFVQTAISKKMKNELEAIFTKWPVEYGTKAEIHTNSIITDEQERQYEEKAQKPAEKQEKPAEKKAEEKIQIDQPQNRAEQNVQKEAKKDEPLVDL